MVWDVATWKLRTKSSSNDEGFSWVKDLTISSDGKILAAHSGWSTIYWGNRNEVNLLDPLSLKRLGTLKAQEDSNSATIVFSPKGLLLAVIDGKKVKLWEIAERK